MPTSTPTPLLSVAIDRQHRLRALVAVAALVAVVAVLLMLRVLTPSDIYDNDQPAPIAHIVDVAYNGQWLMQHGPTGALATKPPMYPWLGAVAVWATGQTREWTFKLPLIVAFLVTTGVVLDLGRRHLGLVGGCVAAAMWAANAHVFKLMYTARTDMLVAMWLALALWALHQQRVRWAAPADGPVGSGPAPLGWIAMFWLCVAAGSLTKGPPAVLAPLWLVLCLAWDRPGRRARLWWQLAGLLWAVALLLGWLWPALSQYPQWQDNIRIEVMERIAGTGSGAKRHTPRLAMYAYFLARFAPWSVLFVTAAALWRPRRWRAAEPVAAPVDRAGGAAGPTIPAWALGWTLLVLVVFMIPRGKRADYILPAYVGAAVAAAAVVAQAQARGGLVRGLVHVVLGGMSIAGVAAAVMVWWAPGEVALGAEGRLPVVDVSRGWTLIVLGAGLAALGGGVGLVCVHRRRYLAGAMAVAVAAAGMLGLYDLTLGLAAQSREGDNLLAMAQAVTLVERQTGQPVVFYRSGYVPVQALLGRNAPAGEADVAALAKRGGALVTSERAWQELAPRVGQRAELLWATPWLKESQQKLLLWRIGPADEPSGRPNGD